MALVTCPECGNQVSGSAVACPKCGFGMSGARETKATGRPLTTIQETSKRLKLHTLGAIGIMILGLLWLIGTLQADSASTGAPGLIMVGGIVWLAVTRFRIWWHHG